MPYTKATLITAPTLEPVSLTELKAWLKIDEPDEDADLADKIRTARVYLEEVTWRVFLTQTWDICFDGFESELVLPKPPVQSITISYVDLNGTTQTLATSVYELGTRHEIGYARLKYDQTWPTARGHSDVVTVRAVCGYGTTADTVPQPLRVAIKYLAAWFYAQREPVNVGNIVNPLPFTIDAMIDPYRIRGYAA